MFRVMYSAVYEVLTDWLSTDSLLGLPVVHISERLCRAVMSFLTGRQQ